MKTAALIIARTNSKSIPGKNFRNLGPVPLVMYSIISAVLASGVDDVFISINEGYSTTKYIQILQDFATTLYEKDPSLTKRCSILLRPNELAQDHVQSAEVFRFVLRQIEMRYGVGHFKTLVLLQPTYPFRGEAFIDDALNEYARYKRERGLCVLVGCQETDNFVYYLNDDYEMVPVGHTPSMRAGRQWMTAHKPTVQENGSIYIIDSTTFGLKGNHMPDNLPLVPFVIDGKVDIDEVTDWDKAEELLKDEYIYALVKELYG